MLSDIKKSVEEFDPQELSTFRKDAAFEKAIAKTGFNQIEPIVTGIHDSVTKNVSVINGFKSSYIKICEKVKSIKNESDKKLKKATETEGERNKLLSELKTSEDDIAAFKNTNQLSETDIEKPLLGTGAIVVIVVITLVEMAISFSSLTEYFSDLIQIVLVNGILAIASSILVMIAGQIAKIKIRIRKAIDTYNNAPMTSSPTLPEWVKEDSAVVFENGKYRLKTLFLNFIIISFILVSVIFTVVKFIVPLMHMNIMAYIVTIIVIVTNILFFVVYEYITYSGLPYSIRSKVDKKLKTIKKIKETLSKMGGLSTKDIESQVKNQLSPLEGEYNTQYVKIQFAQEELSSLNIQAANVLDIVSVFETKLREIDVPYDFQKLRNAVQVPTTETYPSPF